jgi:hypothetical protein
VTQPSNRETALAAGVYGAYQFRKAQDAALVPVLNRVRALFHLHGVPITTGQREQMAEYLYPPLSNARKRTYIASARYLHGQGIVNVPPLRSYHPDAVVKLLEQAEPETVAGEAITESNRTSGVVVEQARKSAARAVSRHAQQPARETVKEAADASGEEVGWARMLTGAYSCAFCAMLASRGPIYRSDKTALYRGGADASTYHDGCDCVAVLVRAGIPWEGQTSQEMLNDLWQETTVQASGKKARNTFRRTWDQKVHDGGSGEFIADSMKPPGGAK